MWKKEEDYYIWVPTEEDKFDDFNRELIFVLGFGDKGFVDFRKEVWQYHEAGHTAKLTPALELLKNKLKALKNYCDNTGLGHKAYRLVREDRKKLEKILERYENVSSFSV